MELSETAVIFLSYLAAFLATSLALVAWQRTSFNWARPFAVMMMALAQWTLAVALELSAFELQAARWWRILQMIGASIMPVAWLTFCARYGGQDHIVTGNKRRLLYVIPLLTIGLAATGSRHGLLWQSWTMNEARQLPVVQYGLWAYIQVAYSSFLTLLGVSILWNAASQWRPEQRWYTVVISLGAALPLVGLLLQLFNIDAFGYSAVLPFFLLGSAAFLAWAVRHQQMLELVPIAREAVLNNMPDGVVVVNNQDRVVEINPAAVQIVGLQSKEVLGRRLVEVMPVWSDLWYEAVVRGELRAEISAQISGETHFLDLRISPVLGRAGHLNGRLIVLRDITDHKRTEQELVARRQLFENLVAVARATAEDSSLQATLQNALDVTTALTGAEYGSLFLLDSVGRVTHSILARGQTAPGSRKEIVGTVMDKGLAGWVVRNRRSVLLPDTSKDERWVNFPDQPYVARSVLVVPITSGSDVPGVLTLQHARAGFFDEEDEALLQAASDQMALALHKAQLFEEQTQLARRQQTLYEALRTVGRHLDPETVIRLATESIARLTGWTAVGILMPHGEGKLVLEAGNGLLAAFEGESFDEHGSELGRAFAGGRTQRRIDAPGASGNSSMVFPFLRSAVFVPLQQGQTPVGVLVAGVDESAAFSDDDVLLAESLAEAVALSMSNAELFQAVADEHTRLEALIEASRDGIILVGDRRQILFLNHTALTLLGLTDEPEDWLYRPLIELFTSLGEEAAPIIDATRREMLRAEDGDMEEGEGEVEIRKRSLRWQNLPVRTETAVVGRLIVLQEVSKERALQRMREDLTHTMVHDLRNPLNVVSGALEMINSHAEQTLGPDPLHLLQIARHSTKRMLNMVNGILKISQLESGKMPLRRTAFDMTGLIDQVLDAQTPLALEKDISLRHAVNGMPLEPHPIRPVFADPELIERVLQNLVSNALKFTPSGGEISVRATADASRQMLIVEVKDTGPGISADIREQLFEKFVTGLHAEKGSGLGLAFCRMAVEEHGGKIWVESESGEGATFYFTLPFVTAEGTG